MFFDREDVGVFTWCTGTLLVHTVHCIILRTIVPYYSVLYCAAQSCRRVVSWWLIIGEGNFEMEKPMGSATTNQSTQQCKTFMERLDWIVLDSRSFSRILAKLLQFRILSTFSFPAILQQLAMNNEQRACNICMCSVQ